MGGETPAPRFPPCGSRGLPPRGRGNHVVLRLDLLHCGSTPAWAGKPCVPLADPSACAVYPRVGGETCAVHSVYLTARGLPPRGRGNQLPSDAVQAAQRSTPAWAGKPPFFEPKGSFIPVYPRVGGETSESGYNRQNGRGLPPRGRGNPLCPGQGSSYARSTPAWAGKPADIHLRNGRSTVYPRVGGETLRLRDQVLRGEGLPPRGRGNPNGQGAEVDVGGSTPAWAGKPFSAFSLAIRSGVYPRVGGETSADGQLAYA